ncbi:MAG: hypothetical protein ACUVUU_03560 [bacterium]
MNQSELKSKIRDLVFQMGACAFGIANVDLEKLQVPGVEARDLKTAISFGYRLSDAVIDALPCYPTRTYQYHYRQVNLLLDHIALRVCAYIHSLNRKALPIPSSQIVDWSNLRGHISHKMIAKLAGIGWIGKNNLLVHPIYGARLRLCTVLTDLDMPSDAPIDNGCGECEACLYSCPGKALRMDGFDLKKCIETIENLRKVENIGSQICGLCVKACRPRDFGAS